MNKFITLMAVLRRKAHLPAVALLALMSGLAAKAGVVVDATNFPDANFRNYLLNEFYQCEDGVLTDGEIATLTSIECDSKSIASLKGIEYLTALRFLSCSENQLTSLDLSKNTKLLQLSCNYNQLTSLDVSKCTELSSLYCDYNQLTSLDVSNNTSLRYFHCNENQLTSLDVSKNTGLNHFFCGHNQLTSLDVSKNTALTYLYCSSNPLMSLDVSNNTALGIIYCSDNQLTSLDVSKNTALNSLFCEANQLTSIDVSKNLALKMFDCDRNQLTTLDVSKNTALERLFCHYNQLTELNLSNNSALESLRYQNQTRTLTVESTVTTEGVRIYYLPLGNNENGYKSIVERMTETNFGGVASKFDLSKVLEWTSGGHVSGDVLFLTDVTEDPTTKTASGMVKYKYNVNNSSDPNGDLGDFTLKWTAPMPEGSTSGPAALELNKKAIRLQLTQSQQLEVVTPDAGEITWTSDNPEAVEVDSTGRVTALKNGIAIITATAANGSSTWCSVYSYLLGDLNEDDNVDISDLNTEVSIVLGN